MLAFLVLLCGASAFDASPRFHFTTQPRIFRRNDDVCQACYGALDCLPINKAQCDYKAATDAIFNDEEGEEFINDSIKKDVDTLMYDLMLKESLHKEYRECVPFISSHTDCHRGNICTGCKKCECGPEGQWNCSVVQQCRRERTVINHRVLVLVMENMKSEAISDPSNRFKRSKEAAEDKTKHRVSPEELIEWMYGAKPMTHAEISKKLHALPEYDDAEGTKEAISDPTNRFKRSKEAAEDKKKHRVSPEELIQWMYGAKPMTHADISKKPHALPEHDDAEGTKELKNTTEPSILGFDEVLREIGLDIKTNSSTSNYVREKSKASIDTEHFLEMLAIEEGKDVTKPTFNENTMVVIDLLNDNGNFGIDTRSTINHNVKDKFNKFKDTDADFNRDMDMMGFSNFVNVMKRDVSTPTTTITRIIATTTPKIPPSNETSNMTALEKLLRNKVLDPVTKLIDDKHKEIDLLINLRNSLIKFMNVCKFNYTYNESQVFDTNSLNNENIEISNFFRRTFGNGNVVILNKYTNKLKKDINEVIRDIIGIRKYQSSNVLPKDLKVLLQAIKFYIKNNRFKLKENKRLRSRKLRNYYSRRQLEYTDYNINVYYIKEALLYMLEVIDRDMPLSNALSPLSPDAKKLFKRVINNNYVDDSAVVGFRINDQNYDMATDLRSIGLINWHEITESIANGVPADRLYNMLLLHFRLSQQIIKLRDALALLKFANSRRMSGIEENIGIKILNRIDKNLNTISYEINHYMNKKNESKHSTKMSLLKKIKKLLSNSKNNMLKIIHKKRVVSDAVDDNKKPPEEGNGQRFLIAMERWQDKFLDQPLRNKRSLREYSNQKNRMKNIIPQYLRGKLNPALSSIGKGIKKKIKPKYTTDKTPVHSKKNIMTSTAKIKTTTVRLNKIKRRH